MSKLFEYRNYLLLFYEWEKAKKPKERMTFGKRMEEIKEDKRRRVKE